MATRGWLKAGLLTGLCLLGLALGVSLWRLSPHAPLSPHFYLMNLSLRGMRPDQLTDWLTRLQNRLSELPVQVEPMPQAVSPLREWGVQLDIPRTRAAILQAWAKVPLWQRLLGNARARITPYWQVDESLFQQRLQAFKGLERPPRDARIRYRQGTIEIVPEQMGLKLSLEGSLQNLLQACQQANLADESAEGIVFPLALEPVPPRLTREQLQPIQGVIGAYTTRFPGYQVNRNHNIRLAATALDGRVLLPGERLSFNAAVGRRTLQQGFRLAPILVRGQKRLGVGGGICQVSSTLFNAALLADLKIVKRTNHGIPVPYVPLGRDATVTDTGLDLVIENPLPTPVAITTELGRSSITVRVLGAPMEGRQVRLQTRWLRSKGRRVALWRLVYENGTLIRRERVAISSYRSPQPPDRKPQKPSRVEQSAPARADQSATESVSQP